MKPISSPPPDRLRVIASDRGFSPVPCGMLQDARITDPTTIAVYVSLGSFMNPRTATLEKGISSIATRARCSDRTAWRHVGLLHELGYIRRTSSGRGRLSHYVLADPWSRRCDQIRPVPPVSRVTGDTGRRCHGTHDTGVTGCRQTRDTGGTRSRERESRERECSHSLLVSIRERALKAGAGWTFATSRWKKAIGALLKDGVQPDRILAAFKACLAHEPEKVGFFPSDFPKWATVNDAKNRRMSQPKCSECGCTLPSHATSCSQLSRKAS